MNFLAGRSGERLLMGSPLRRPAVAFSFSAALLLLLAFAALTVCLLLDGLRAEGASVFLRSLLAASFLSCVPVGIIWWLDRRERESPWLYAVAFLWGGLIATSAALPLNQAILAAIERWVAQHQEIKDLLGHDAVRMIGAPIAGPLVEEVTKGAGIVILFLFLRAEYNNMRDGFIYGALIGAGFNWFEAPLYVAQGFVQFGDAPWQFQLGARFALFGLAGHALFSGLFGLFLGLAGQTRSKVVRYVAPCLGLLIAIAAHLVYNVMPLVVAIVQSRQGEAPPSEPTPPPDIGLLESWLTMSAVDLVILAPFFLLMMWLLWRSGKWEVGVIREELASEAAPTVTSTERAAIEQGGIFQTRRIVGPDRKVATAIVNAQHELAFRKRHVRDQLADPETDPLVIGWREDILALRAELGQDGYET